jgi:hypothetical protein
LAHTETHSRFLLLYTVCDRVPSPCAGV